MKNVDYIFDKVFASKKSLDNIHEKK